MKTSISLYSVKTKEKLMNIKMNPQTHREFKLAAELRGATMSSLIHQFIVRIIREEKDRYPIAFFYLNAGGSVRRALELAREFGTRPISDDNREHLRKMAEAEKADDAETGPDEFTATPYEDDNPIPLNRKGVK